MECILCTTTTGGGGGGGGRHHPIASCQKEKKPIEESKIGHINRIEDKADEDKSHE
jgi:hypothetical protein